MSCGKSTTGTTAVERSGDLDTMIATLLDVLRRGDHDAWNTLLLSRDEYEERCAELVRKNSPGWLDKTMARRSDLTQHAVTRCNHLASDTRLKVLWSSGTEYSRTTRIAECVAYDPREPVRLVVAKANGDRMLADLRLMWDIRAKTFVPTGYVECHPAKADRVACNRMSELVAGQLPEGVSYFSPYTCSQILRAESVTLTSPVVTCLEGAKDAAAAKSCWGKRPWTD